ncbi:MAG: SH3 domain-containing protein [Lachnospiraceae bacterium]|nr:SH3 domain-containing protein [Lachnospiraceae bacterium]
MKKAIPVIIAIALIIIVGVAYIGMKFLGRYTYSEEYADLNEYYAVSGEETAIVLQDEIVEEKALLRDGSYYFDYATVRKYFNDRFYVDKTEGLLLYTTAVDTIRTEIGSNIYVKDGMAEEESYVLSFYEGETLYLAADYVKKFSNYSYEAFAKPNRLQVYTEWGEIQTAQIKKDTSVRYQGGVKSDILKDVYADDTVTVLEEMENWSKVKTADAVIGYVENKRLYGKTTTEQIPITDYVEPEYTSLTRDYKINLAWHQVWSADANSTLDEMMAATKTVNVISPTWFSLSDNEGNFTNIASTSYVQRAHDMGLEVWALIDNFSTEIDTKTILSSTTKRAYLINNLVQTVKDYGIDGINIDFEQVAMDAGDDYIQFIRELSVVCRKEGIVLSVDNYVPTAYTAHYNRKEQGLFADYVIIMGYDEYYAGSPEAGPVSSIEYVENGIADTVEVVPANKVINAVPFYTRVWKTTNGTLDSEAVSMDVATQFIANNGIETYWNETTCHNYGEAQIGDVFYQVWLEDTQALQDKLNVMKKYNLGGVAEWKLGLENAAAWDLIANYMNE